MNASLFLHIWVLLFFGIVDSERLREKKKTKKAPERGRLPLIPFPAKVDLRQDEAPFSLKRKISLSVGTEVGSGSAEGVLRNALDTLEKPSGPQGEAAIELSIQPCEDRSPESYELTVSQDKVTLSAPAPAGLFYGAQTLRQLIQAEHDAIPALKIEDAPRFEWRGFMLDVSRHFFNHSEIMGFLDVMSEFKLNRFHFHLTDDQGWRLPVRAYPKLTEVGAEGYGGRRSFTAEEIKQIVEFAKERHIEVIPEVDTPGHVIAAIAAYPELGNTDSPSFKQPEKPTKEFGAFDYTLGFTNASWTFLDTVYATLGDSFPAKWVHIGGDEANNNQWRSSPTARAAMQRQPHGTHYQAVFTEYASKCAAKQNRTVISWDEALQTGGLPNNSIVMAWRSENEVVKAVRQGKRTIVANLEYYYFDRRSAHGDTEPAKVPSVITAEMVYDHEPIPSRVTEARKEHLILGGQAQLWSEWMDDFPTVQERTFPRGLALAERLWTPAEQIVGFGEFKDRLNVRIEDLVRRNVKYHKF